MLVADFKHSLLVDPRCLEISKDVNLLRQYHVLHAIELLAGYVKILLKKSTFHFLRIGDIIRISGKKLL